MKYNKLTQFTEREKEYIRIMLWHAKVDMGYGAGGSYTNYGNPGESLNEKELAKGERGLALVHALLDRMDEYGTNHS